MGFRESHGDSGRGFTLDLRKVDRAICEKEEDAGYYKIMYCSHHKVHGATIVCQRAGELINELALCMHQDIKVTELGRVIHAYPSFAFALQKLCADIAVEASFHGLTGKVIKWFKKV